MRSSSATATLGGPSPSPGMPDEYDRLLVSLDGLPHVMHTKPSTIDVVPMLGVRGSTTFILHTVRQQGRGGLVFLRAVGPGGWSFRIVLAPAVTECRVRCAAKRHHWGREDVDSARPSPIQLTTRRCRTASR